MTASNDIVNDRSVSASLSASSPSTNVSWMVSVMDPPVTTGNLANTISSSGD